MPEAVAISQNQNNPNLVNLTLKVKNIGNKWIDEFTYSVDFGDDEGTGAYMSSTILPGESYEFTISHEYSQIENYNLSFDVETINELEELNDENNHLNVLVHLEELTCSLCAETDRSDKFNQGFGYDNTKYFADAPLYDACHPTKPGILREVICRADGYVDNPEMKCYNGCYEGACLPEDRFTDKIKNFFKKLFFIK